MRGLRRIVLTVGFLCLGGAAGRSEASFGVGLTFNDSGGTYSSYYSQITSNVQAAATLWSNQIANTSGSIRIQVNFTGESTASAGSTSSQYVGTSNGINVFQQGALAHVLNGYTSSNPYDAVLNIGTNYLTSTLFFDPNPAARTAAIPTNRVDAVSVFAHEIGHMLVFNGFRNLTNGTLPGDYESTYDQQTVFDGTNYFFVGPRAQAIYGGPVPLTYGNIFHVGNANPRPGVDLTNDLMNGVVFYYQRRYSISALDLAIAADTGVPLQQNAVPEPASLALVGSGLAVVGLVRAQRRGKRPAA